PKPSILKLTTGGFFKTGYFTIVAIAARYAATRTRIIPQVPLSALVNDTFYTDNFRVRKSQIQKRPLLRPLATT
ncbi:MAG: hypothetical protein ACRC1W_03480, partial [Shewanella sp.]